MTTGQQGSLFHAKRTLAHMSTKAASCISFHHHLVRIFSCDCIYLSIFICIYIYVFILWAGVSLGNKKQVIKTCAKALTHVCDVLMRAMCTLPIHSAHNAILYIRGWRVWPMWGEVGGWGAIRLVSHRVHAEVLESRLVCAGFKCSPRVCVSSLQLI